MKQFKFLSALLLMVSSLGLLSSCDEDLTQSMALSGDWRGDFGMYYTYEENGHYYTFDSYDTYMVFYPDYDYATHGWGKEVDYYDYGPYKYQYYQFVWSIRNGIIYLTYPYDGELNTAITDYHMTNDRFTGTFPGSTNKFSLYKMTDYYDWTPFVDTWGYSSRSNWGNYYPYYAKGVKGDTKTVTVSDSIQGQIVKRGNRFTDNK